MDLLGRGVLEMENRTKEEMHICTLNTVGNPQGPRGIVDHDRCLDQRMGCRKDLEMDKREPMWQTGMGRTEFTEDLLDDVHNVLE